MSNANEFEGFTPGTWECRSRSVSDNSLIVADEKYDEICVIRERTQALRRLVERSGGFRGEVPFDNALRTARFTLASLEGGK